MFVTARLPEREELFKWVGPIGPDDWVLLARGDSPINLTSLDQARQYTVGAYKGDAIAEHLEGQGLQPVLALRDQENVKSCSTARSTSGPRATRPAATWLDRKA